MRSTPLLGVLPTRVACVVALLASSCKTEEAPASAPAAAAPVPLPPPPADPEPIPVMTSPPSEKPATPVLQLLLRSSPAGAVASVDGRPVGPTPAHVRLPADGKEHDFAFELDGHAPWRLRFMPVRDGVVHATMTLVKAPAAK